MRYQQDFAKLVSKKIYNVDSIKRMRRSIVDNRKLHIEIYTLRPNGYTEQTFLNVLFSSVFRLYQFLELVEKIQNNLIQTLILQSELKNNEKVMSEFAQEKQQQIE